MGNKLAYAEVNTILNHMDKKYVIKIPQKLREFFLENSLDNNVVFNPRIPLEEQELQKETFSILAMLNLNYWCESEEHKQELINTYKEQDIIKEEKSRELYNPDNIFKNKREARGGENTNLPVEIKKETFFKKLINFIKGLFNKTNK